MDRPETAERVMPGTLALEREKNGLLAKMLKITSAMAEAAEAGQVEEISHLLDERQCAIGKINAIDGEIEQFLLRPGSRSNGECGRGGFQHGCAQIREEIMEQRKAGRELAGKILEMDGRIGPVLARQSAEIRKLHEKARLARRAADLYSADGRRPGAVFIDRAE